MNRFGWIVLVLFFVGGVLAFRSNDRPAEASGQVPVVSPAPTPSPGVLRIPVVGIPASALRDTWGEARENGARVHQAIDIPAPGGTPVVAAMAGRVEKLHISERGGMTAYVRDASGRWLTYYAHLANYAPGLREGQSVRTGDPIGFVGDTGNAGPGNTHLHFALHRMQPGEAWYRGTPVNPYPLLARKPPAR